MSGPAHIAFQRHMTATPWFKSLKQSVKVAWYINEVRLSTDVMDCDAQPEASSSG